MRDLATIKSLLPGVPLVESPFFDEIIEVAGFDAETAQIARDLNQNGFACFKFPDPEIDARADRIRRDLAGQFDLKSWGESGRARGESLRVQDAWETHADVRAIACNERMLKILSDIYGRRAWPFQTLNFAVGSQQSYHSDSIHFSSIPERFVCGVWLALEDISDDVGPLVYYPGSHKWPIVYNDQIGIRLSGSVQQGTQDFYTNIWAALIEKHSVAPQYFRPKKGEALIWAANLLHGGVAHRDAEKTRWSQVTHYYFDDCCYITPMFSDVMIGKLYLRDMTDISTGKKVPNVYVDKPLSELTGNAVAGSKISQAPLPRDFNPARYLKLHPDVKAAGMDAGAHYRQYGFREGRPYNETLLARLKTRLTNRN
jgi:Phytanoyl-CoA dioxygenase (PhyH)